MTNLTSKESTSSGHVEGRLLRLEDAESIHDLFLRYGRLLDAKDWVPYSELFAENGQLISSAGVGTATGPQEIRALFDTRLKDVPVGAFHVFSNVDVDVDGDRATAFSMWMYVTLDEQGWPTITQFGHYDDVVVREGGSWKFERREITRDIGFPPYKR